jgi:hypothetical protein
VLPLFSVPRFRSCIARSTFLPAPLEYLRAISVFLLSPPVFQRRRNATVPRRADKQKAFANDGSRRPPRELPGLAAAFRILIGTCRILLLPAAHVIAAAATALLVFLLILALLLAGLDLTALLPLAEIAVVVVRALLLTLLTRLLLIVVHRAAP